MVCPRPSHRFCIFPRCGRDICHLAAQTSYCHDCKLKRAAALRHATTKQVQMAANG